MGYCQVSCTHMNNDGQLRPPTVLGIQVGVLGPTRVERDIRQTANHRKLDRYAGGDDQRRVAYTRFDVHTAIPLEAAGKIEREVSRSAMEEQAGKICISQSGQRDIGCAGLVAQERHFGQVRGGEINFGIGCAIFDGQVGQSQAAEFQTEPLPPRATHYDVTPSSPRVKPDFPNRKLTAPWRR